MVQFGGEMHLLSALVLAHKIRRHAVLRRGFEILDFTLALHNQPDCHRLHPPCTQPRGDLAPQDGGQLETYDTVQHAACLLRIHKIVVNITRMLDCLLNGSFRNLMKDNTMSVLRL